MKNEIWKYVPSFKTKHAFWESEVSISICGTSTIWHSNAKWLTDEEGLKTKPECKRCARILRGYNA